MVTEEAIEIMGTGKAGHKFQMCCQNVCTWASLLEGSNWPRHHWRTVARWHAEFRTLDTNQSAMILCQHDYWCLIIQMKHLPSEHSYGKVMTVLL